MPILATSSLCPSTFFSSFMEVSTLLFNGQGRGLLGGFRLQAYVLSETGWSIFTLVAQQVRLFIVNNTYGVQSEWLTPILNMTARKPLIAEPKAYNCNSAPTFILTHQKQCIDHLTFCNIFLLTGTSIRFPLHTSAGQDNAF